MRVEETNIILQWLKKMPDKRFIMWLAIGCLQSGSLCSFSILLWALQLPLSSMAVDYGPLDGHVTLKRLCNSDATIWDPLKAHCRGSIPLKEMRNQMVSIFAVVCRTSGYTQAHCTFQFILSLLKKQKIYKYLRESASSMQLLIISDISWHLLCLAMKRKVVRIKKNQHHPFAVVLIK